MEKIAAGIVTFNPDIKRLKDNVNAILTQVDKVYIYDNGSKNCEEVSIFTANLSKVEIYTASKNDGLACALNGLMNMAFQDGFDWLVSLDQDSVMQENTIKEFIKYADRQDVAIICPFAIDSRRKYMKYEYTSEVEEINKCITSGSMTRLSIWDELGGFDEFLFIDLIDDDYCKKITLNKYKILRINTVLMNQEWGKIIPRSDRVVRFFVKLGEMLHNTNIQKLSYKKTVDPRRIYYTCRNILYLNKKYKNYGGIGYRNYNSRTFAGFLFYFCFGSVVRADKKLYTAQMCIKGLREGHRKALETRPLVIGG
mgnify:CR=1 FL=1